MQQWFKDNSGQGWEAAVPKLAAFPWCRPRSRGGGLTPAPGRPSVGAQAPWETVKPAARGLWDQQRWRRPRRRERPGRQPRPALQPGPRGCLAGPVGGGPERGPGSGWPPPPPRRGTGTGRGAVAGEDAPEPGGRLPHGQGRAGPRRPGRTGGRGNTAPGSVANQRPRPFCPRGGRTRRNPAVVGAAPRSGAGDLRVLRLRPCPRALHRAGARGWGRERVPSPPFRRLHLQPGGAGVKCGMPALGLVALRPLPYLTRGPK